MAVADADLVITHVQLSRSAELNWFESECPDTHTLTVQYEGAWMRETTWQVSVSRDGGVWTSSYHEIGYWAEDQVCLSFGQGHQYRVRVRALDSSGTAVSDWSPSIAYAAPSRIYRLRLRDAELFLIVPDDYGLTRRVRMFDTTYDPALCWLACGFGADWTWVVQRSTAGRSWTTIPWDYGRHGLNVRHPAKLGTRYAYRVRAVGWGDNPDRSGTPRFSSPWANLTLPPRYKRPSKIRNFQVAERGSTAVLLTWDPPRFKGGAPISKYRLRFQARLRTGQPRFHVDCKIKRKRACLVTSMVAGRWYQVRIRADNGHRYGKTARWFFRNTRH